MTLLDELSTSDAPAVMNLIAAYVAPAPSISAAAWNNQATWDNWQKSPAPFDNRPTWDNWNKKK